MREALKILIIRNDHIGDLVLSSAVFREIKKALPNSKITLVTSRLGRAVVEKNKNIDEILELGLAQYNFSSFVSYWKLSREIRKRKFDVGIDLRGSILNAFFLLWLAGIKKRVGKIDAYNGNKKKAKINSLFLNVPIWTGHFETDKHITKENIEIVNKALDIKAKNFMPEIITDESDEKEVNDFIKKNKLKKYICICPVASNEYKQWKLENFSEVIKWLDNYEFDILLLGTKDEESKLNELAKNSKKCRVIVNYDLRKMALLFKKSEAVLAQDGGPMHIAWTAKANIIEMVPKYHQELGRGKFAPLNKNSIVLWAKDNSMDTISIETVKNAIKKMVKI